MRIQRFFLVAALLLLRVAWSGEVDELTPDDIDLVVDAKRQVMFILHGKPLHSQGHIRSVLYNPRTYQFTFIAEDGAEQLLKNIVVSEPLRDGVIQCRTITLMWVNDSGRVMSPIGIQKLPLLFLGN